MEYSVIEDTLQVSEPLDSSAAIAIDLEDPDPGEQDIALDKGDSLGPRTISTSLPARLDSLPWSWWHCWVITALGISWILDGFEVTTIGLIGNVLQSDFHMTEGEVGLCGTFYLAGAISGSLFFGLLSDILGRKKLFVIIPSIYGIGTLLTVFSFHKIYLWLCLVVVGFGIGGEYSAMNSAINELIPSKVRGMVDLIVNGSYWLGGVLGGTLTFFTLSVIGRFLPAIAWRLPWVMGCVVAVMIILLRLFIPESPRWLAGHDRLERAEEIVSDIERKVYKTQIHFSKNKWEIPSTENGLLAELPTVDIRVGERVGLLDVLVKLWKGYKGRTVLGLSLMIAQAFFYNAIFFTFATTLSHYYHVPKEDTGLFIIPFAACNFLGALLLGRLFDIIGRKIMISATYTISGTLLILTGIIFVLHLTNAVTHTICWSIIFFFSSASASAAYLTVAEIFPLEVRAIAIAVFYSAGTGLGGLTGDTIFGFLVQTGNRWALLGGYCLGASLMFIATIVELVFGVNAEGKGLEEIAPSFSEVKKTKSETDLLLQ